ncbi:succinate dehydrogenase cytochrome b subunit [Schlesneria sp. T3-172]|uniref:succinate dehydrogenase cytochrome b subunit n=1 Tax=Schlesneria sphaerica TaxID=3373610 RepID=UPI0037CA5D8B
MTDSSVQSQTGLIDWLGLGWFFRLLSSSIGQKFVMGLTGLLLCGFLAAHLAGNLLLFVGPKAFNEYAHKLHEQWELLIVAETGLLILFLAHIYLAITTTIGNYKARRESYVLKQSKVPHRIIGANSWMFASGAVVLGFVILHLIDLRLGMRGSISYLPESDPEAPFKNTIAALSDPVSRVVYFVGAIVLGVHLSHGFASAFQSLGLNHPKYTPLIKIIGKVFAVVIAVGFASLAVFAPGMWK